MPSNKPLILPQASLSAEIKKVIEDNDCEDVYALPRRFKKRFEAYVATNKEFMDQSDMGKELDINEELAVEFNRLLRSLNYLINSTSYREGKYFDFDKEEISRKLGRK